MPFPAPPPPTPAAPIQAFDGRALVPVQEVPAGGWIHLTAPTPPLMAAVRERLKVPDEFIWHALDPDELARVDTLDEDRALVVLRVPVVRPTGREAPAGTLPLGAILLPGAVVTIAREPTPVAELLAARPGLDPAHQNQFLLLLLLVTADRFLADQRSIDQTVAALEEQLESSLRNREVTGLLRCQKALVRFSTALRSNLLMLERLQKEPWLELKPRDHDLLDDVLVEARQALHVAETAGNILSETMDAFASIISNNLNVVMKVLTSITLALNVPILIASFYGMNVPLPGEEHPLAFAALFALSAAAAAGVAALLWRKRWLS